MKKMKFLIAMFICVLSDLTYEAGLAKTKSGMETLQNSIHAIGGVVFLITGLIVGALIWRGNKTWEDCSKWVIGVAFAGGAAEFIGIFFS